MHAHPYPIALVSQVLSPATVVLARPDASITTLAFDTRKLVEPAKALFFALQGNRDGHAFLADAYRAGVRNFVVLTGVVSSDAYPEANLLFVSDTLRALQDLAAYHRSQFDIPVIGVTGSNGKTIVKEWLYQLLSPRYRIHRSPKSYNSQLGVALSLWQMDSRHTLAIIEAGISQPGEMASLNRMIRPTLGVLTGIGPAHDAGFASREEKIREKWLLFYGAERVIHSPAHIDGADVASTNHFTWGVDHAADLTIIDRREIGEGATEIRAQYKGQPMAITIPFTDTASMDNAITCWAVMLALGYEGEEIAQGMRGLAPVGMRLELKRGVGNCTVIDDSYSNDMASLVIALDFLKQQNQHEKRSVILSDFPGILTDDTAFYQGLAALLAESGIDRLVTVGPDLASHGGLFKFLNHHAFPDTEALIASLPALAFRDETVLIKGARRYRFERLSRLLTEKLHDTVLEVNLQALEANLKAYKAQLPTHVKLMAMVKAFSYGSGSFEIANILQFNQLDYLTVAYLDEGVQLRRAGISLPIVVMSPDIYAFESLLRHRLEPEIFSFPVLESFVAYLEEREVAAFPIHVKFDTGMHRLGFAPEDAPKLVDYLVSAPQVRVASVFSHLAAAGDSAHDDFTRMQIRSFQQAADTMEAGLPYPFLRHIANTAAIERWPAAYFDMVRLGIGLYGIGRSMASLSQVGTMKTTISQIRRVPAGESVGYGRQALLETDRTIATVKVGYADGYDRRFGNGVGRMVVRGHEVPTVGNICMDMCMLDITGVDAVEGDEVIVFGDVDAMAELIGTIPYEILAGISQRVKRVYYYE